MSSISSGNFQDRCKQCFLEWMNTQRLDLEEILQVLDQNHQDSENTLNQLRDKVIQHFQDYTDERLELAKSHVSSYFAPSWISTTENSLLWVAGCRPSVYIRLLYALCGSEVEKNFSRFIQEGVRANNLGNLSWNQLNLVNELHLKTVKKEDQLSNRLASLQEDMADRPIATTANGQDEKDFASNENVKRAFVGHDNDMFSALKEAENLRLSMLKELLSILTPLQGLEYLAAAKKLHLCLHHWGKKRDQMQGIQK